MTDVSALRARAANATPELVAKEDYEGWYLMDVRTGRNIGGRQPNAANDAAFMVAARADVLALCDEIEALRAERDAAIDLLEQAAQIHLNDVGRIADLEAQLRAHSDRLIQAGMEHAETERRIRKLTMAIQDKTISEETRQAIAARYGGGGDGE